MSRKLPTPSSWETSYGESSSPRSDDQPPPYQTTTTGTALRDTFSRPSPVTATSSFRVRAQAARDARLQGVTDAAMRVIAASVDQGELAKAVALILPLRSALSISQSSAISKGAALADEAFHPPPGIEIFGGAIDKDAEVLFLPDSAGTVETWQDAEMLNSLRSSLGHAFELPTREPSTGALLTSAVQAGLLVSVGEVYCRTENAFGIFETTTRKAIVVRAFF